MKNIVVTDIQSKKKSKKIFRAFLSYLPMLSQSSVSDGECVLERLGAAHASQAPDESRLLHELFNVYGNTLGQALHLLNSTTITRKRAEPDSTFFCHLDLYKMHEKRVSLFVLYDTVQRKFFCNCRQFAANLQRDVQCCRHSLAARLAHIYHFSDTQQPEESQYDNITTETLTIEDFLLQILPNLHTKHIL